MLDYNEIKHDLLKEKLLSSTDQNSALQLHRV